MSTTDYNSSAALNTTLGGIAIGPGMERNKVNDAIQQLMADTASDLVALDAGTGAVSRTMRDKARDRITAKDFGATQDGTADDSAELQAMIDKAIATKRECILPGGTGDYRINSALTITGPVKIRGDGKGLARIIAVGCDVFQISAGVNDVTIENLNIAQGTRYTTTPNSYSAIVVNGTTVSPCYRHRYSDLFIDGFEYGVEATALCASHFDIHTAYTFGSIYVKGQSVNNSVGPNTRLACMDSISSAAPANSFGIRVGDGTAPQPEGFCISRGAVVFGVKRGLHVHGAINVESHGVIYDGIGEYGILEQSSDTALAMNNSFCFNYFGMGNAADTAYYHTSTATALSGQNRGTIFGFNEIALYGATAINYGMLVEGSFSNNITIINNEPIKGAGGLVTLIRDCKISAGTGHRIIGNSWNTTTGFETAATVVYEGNTGRLAVGSSFCAKAGTLTATTTWDPGNLVDGAGETSAGITVTGAALGDYVQVAAPYDLQGITCTAWVSATDTVKIRLQNETGGAIDLASGTWRVAVNAIA